MEAVLRLNSGQIGVLGGLMQDSSSQTDNQLPGTKGMGFFSKLFGSTKKSFEKSELVILIRPIIIREPSIGSDLSAYRQYLDSYDASTREPAGSEAR